MTGKEIERTFLDDRNILYLGIGLVTQVYTYVKNHRMIKFVYFAPCKFYFKAKYNILFVYMQIKCTDVYDLL